jgi:hypothetical protein
MTGQHETARSLSVSLFAELWESSCWRNGRDSSHTYSLSLLDCRRQGYASRLPYWILPLSSWTNPKPLPKRRVRRHPRLEPVVGVL